MDKENIRKEISKLSDLAEKIKQNLERAPEGSLMISKGSSSYRFYRYYNKSKKAILSIKENEQLIKALAQKDYDKKVLKQVKEMLLHLKMFVLHFPESSLADIYDSLHIERKPLVSPYEVNAVEKTRRWQALKYQGNPKEFSHSFKTNRGELVRSKSEKIIADKLFSAKIPYRYEYPYRMKGLGIVYPDFTVLNPRTGQEFIFEHFGMMDDPEYRANAFRKIEIYAANGFVHGKNFLYTVEASSHQFDFSYLDSLVKTFLN